VQSGTAQPFFRANAAMQPGFDERSILRLFESVLPTVRWKALEGRAKAQTYTLRVVIWMMLLQRLAERGTQQRVVHGVAQGHLERLLPSSKRVREGKISQNSGAYARACGRLSMETTAQVCDEVLAESRKRIAPELELERPVMLLDGSSLSVEHSPSFLEAFPPGRNRRGLGHRGIVKWVDLHDVRTGIALRPVRGPMYGPQTVSEQVLARQAVERTPAGGVIVGDGNFGIFSFAYAVVQSERETVFRLTKARKRWEQSGCCPTESAEFAGSRAASSGKVSRIARRCGHRRPPECGYAEGFSRQRYLFTTLSEEIEAEKIVAWNGKRWNLELDLRTLKGTPRLKHLPGKSKAAVEKELLIAVVAYGFVRALKREAAERAGLHPRELSFTCARGLLNAMTGQLCSLDADQRRQAYDRLLA